MTFKPGDKVKVAYVPNEIFIFRRSSDLDNGFYLLEDSTGQLSWAHKDDIIGSVIPPFTFPQSHTALLKATFGIREFNWKPRNESASVVICECGSEISGSNRHSTWCPKGDKI